MIDSGSFFWLGLVAALAVGVFLIVVHTRNDRRPRGGAAFSGLQGPAEAPTLWEAYIEPTHVYQGIARNDWYTALPLSFTTFRPPKSPTPVPQYSSGSSWVFSCFRQSPSPKPVIAHQTSESSEDASLSAIIILPNQHLQNNSAVQSRQFAIGTLPASYLNDMNDDEIGMTVRIPRE